MDVLIKIRSTDFFSFFLYVNIVVPEIKGVVLFEEIAYCDLQANFAKILNN